MSVSPCMWCLFAFVSVCPLPVLVEQCVRLFLMVEKKDGREGCQTFDCEL